MNSGKIILGVLAGVAVGAILGILFAPEKGSKTRKKIAEKGINYSEELQDKFEGFCNMLIEKVEHIKEGSEDLVTNTKKKYFDTKKEAENLIS